LVAAGREEAKAGVAHRERAGFFYASSRHAGRRATRQTSADTAIGTPAVVRVSVAARANRTSKT
jgi:hypothetical protein